MASIYDHKRTIRVKGPLGEIEVIFHDTKSDNYGASIPTVKEMLDEVVKHYNELKVEK